MLAYLVGFDIAGAVVCLIFDIFSFGHSDMSAYYALWAVLGILCGIFSYDTCGKIASRKSGPDRMSLDETKQDWTKDNKSGRIGLLVIFTTLAVLVTLSAIFYVLWWQYNVEPSGFVPDSRPLTLTFFVAVLASSIFAHRSLRPSPKKSA